jgi:hypothetical protein
MIGLLAAVHEFGPGTTRTSRDVRSSVAIGCKADLSRTSAARLNSSTGAGLGID